MSDETPPIDDYERALWALGIDEETRKTYKAAGPDLCAALKALLEVIEAHELESLSCDSDGERWCECLWDAKTAARTALSKVEGRE